MITISAQEKANIYTLTTPDGTEQILPRTVVEAVTGALPSSGGTMTGNINMGGKKITNTTHVAGPSVTINGADNTYIVTGSAANIVGYTSGDISVVDHTIRMVKDPVAPQDAVNKRYVDARPVGTGDFKSDGSVPMAGPVSFEPATGKNELKNVRFIRGENGVTVDFWDAYGFQIFGSGYSILEMNQGQLLFFEPTKIVNVANPESPQDAATKSYVDSKVGGFPNHQHVLDDSLGHTFNDAVQEGVYAIRGYNPRGTGVPPDLLDWGVAFSGTLIVTTDGDGQFWQILQVDVDNTLRLRYGNPNEYGIWTKLGGSGDFKSDGSVSMTGTFKLATGDISFTSNNTAKSQRILGALGSTGGRYAFNFTFGNCMLQRITGNGVETTCFMLSGDNTNFNGHKVTGIGVPVSATDATNKAYVDGFFETYKSKVDAPSSGVPTRMGATSNNMYYWRDSLNVGHICGNIVYDSEVSTILEAFRIPEIFVNESLAATYYPAIVSEGLLSCAIQIFPDGRVFLETIGQPFSGQRTLHLDISYPLYT